MAPLEVVDNKRSSRLQDGWRVVEVARRLGVSRQSVHNWIARYERTKPGPRYSIY